MTKKGKGVMAKNGNYFMIKKGKCVIAKKG